MNDQNMLILNPEDAFDSKDASSSLEDVYGYQVFGTEYEKNISEAESAHKTELEQLFTNVFDNTKDDETMSAYNAVMSAPSNYIIKKDYTSPVSTQGIIETVGYVTLGMMMAGTVLMMIEHRKKRKHAKKNNDSIR